jgi:hypothetical protein
MTSIDDIPIQPDRKKSNLITQHLGVGISLIALTISIASFWQGRQNAALQNELARPVLEIGHAAMLPMFDNKEGQIGVTLGLKNVGKLAAVVTDAHVMPLLHNNSGVLYSSVECMHVKNALESTANGIKIDVSDTSLIAIRVDREASCPLQKKQDFRVTINYSDSKGDEYGQHFNVGATLEELPTPPNQ